MSVWASASTSASAISAIALLGYSGRLLGTSGEDKGSGSWQTASVLLGLGVVATIVMCWLVKVVDF